MATLTTGDRQRSPPKIPRQVFPPKRSRQRVMPSYRSNTHWTAQDFGSPKPIVMPKGSAPMAARSDKFATTDRHPAAAAGVVCGLKCTPSTNTSVVTTKGWAVLFKATIAASSPTIPGAQKPWSKLSKACSP